MEFDPLLEFIEFLHLNEDELHSYEPLAGSYAIIQVNHKVLSHLIDFGNGGSCRPVKEK